MMIMLPSLLSEILLVSSLMCFTFSILLRYCLIWIREREKCLLAHDIAWIRHCLNKAFNVYYNAYVCHCLNKACPTYVCCSS